MNIFKGALPRLAGAVLALSLLAGCGIPDLNPADITEPESEPEVQTEETVEPEISEAIPEEPEAAPAAAETPAELTADRSAAGSTAADYVEVYNAFAAAAVHAEAAEEVRTLAGTSLPASSVQTGDFTEGSFAAVSGDVLAVLSSSELVLLRAAGAESAEIGRISLSDYLPSGADYAQGLAVFTNGSCATVICREAAGSGQQTHILVFDIAAPEAPVLTCDFVQSGRYLGSCQNGDGLWILSSFPVDVSNEENLGGFLPAITENGEDRFLNPDEILLSPVTESLDMTVLVRLSLSSVPDSQAIALTGYYGTAAVSDGRIILFGDVTTVTTAEPRQEEPYTVTDAVCSADTQIVSLDADTLSDVRLLCAEGRLKESPAVSGEGILTLSLSAASLRYAVFEDARYGFRNLYLYSEDTDELTLRVTGMLEETEAPADAEADDEVDPYAPELPEEWILKGLSPEDILVFSEDSVFYFCSEYGMIAEDIGGQTLAELHFSFG